MLVDLDHNRLVIPEYVKSHLPTLPQAEHSILVTELRKFLHNDLFYLDNYYSASRATIPSAKRPQPNQTSITQPPPFNRHTIVLSPRASEVGRECKKGKDNNKETESERDRSTSSQISASFDEAVRHAFLLFFVSLFKDYRDHLIYLRVFPEPMAIFNKKEFLKLRPDSEVTLLHTPPSVFPSCFLRF